MDFIRLLNNAVIIGVKLTRIASEMRDLTEELRREEPSE